MTATLTDQQARAAKVHDFVNQPTGSGSLENRIQQMVRKAVSWTQDFLDQPENEHGEKINRYSGEPLKKQYGEILGLCKGIEIATGLRITVQDIAAAAGADNL